MRDTHTKIKFYDNSVPEFPQKKIFGNKNPKFLEQRRIELENYLNSIVKLSKLMRHTFTKEFFHPIDSVRIDYSQRQSTLSSYKEIVNLSGMQEFVDNIYNQLN